MVFKTIECIYASWFESMSSTWKTNQLTYLHKLLTDFKIDKNTLFKVNEEVSYQNFNMVANSIIEQIYDLAINYAYKQAIGEYYRDDYKPFISNYEYPNEFIKKHLVNQNSSLYVNINMGSYYVAIYNQKDLYTALKKVLYLYHHKWEKRQILRGTIITVNNNNYFSWIKYLKENEKDYLELLFDRYDIKENEKIIRILSHNIESNKYFEDVIKQFILFLEDWYFSRYSEENRPTLKYYIDDYVLKIEATIKNGYEIQTIILNDIKDIKELCESLNKIEVPSSETPVSNYNVVVTEEEKNLLKDFKKLNNEEKKDILNRCANYVDSSSTVNFNIPFIKLSTNSYQWFLRLMTAFDVQKEVIYNSILYNSYSNLKRNNVRFNELIRLVFETAIHKTSAKFKMPFKEYVSYFKIHVDGIENSFILTFDNTTIHNIKELKDWTDNNLKKLMTCNISKE